MSFNSFSACFYVTNCNPPAGLISYSIFNWVPFCKYTVCKNVCGKPSPKHKLCFIPCLLIRFLVALHYFFFPLKPRHVHFNHSSKLIYAIFNATYRNAFMGLRIVHFNHSKISSFLLIRESLHSWEDRKLSCKPH